jgi:hypothetical protein
MRKQDIVERFGELILEDFEYYESILTSDEDGDHYVVTKLNDNEFEVETYYA